MMAETLLTCALALPAAPYHHTNGKIVAELNQVLIRGVHAMNPGSTLMVAGSPDWVMTLRRLSLTAWRVTQHRPRTSWDVIALEKHLPFAAETFRVIYHEKYQPRMGTDETTLLQTDWVLAPMGFLIFDSHSHHNWVRWLEMLDYFRLPFTWNNRQIFQKPGRRAA